jgi:hypothetical protein
MDQKQKVVAIRIPGSDMAAQVAAVVLEDEEGGEGRLVVVRMSAILLVIMTPLSQGAGKMLIKPLDRSTIAG